MWAAAMQAPPALPLGKGPFRSRPRSLLDLHTAERLRPDGMERWHPCRTCAPRRPSPHPFWLLPPMFASGARSAWQQHPLTLGPGGMLLLALRLRQVLRTAAVRNQGEELAGCPAVEVQLLHCPLLAQHDVAAGNQVPVRAQSTLRPVCCALGPARGSCSSRPGLPRALDGRKYGTAGPDPATPQWWPS